MVKGGIEGMLHPHPTMKVFLDYIRPVWVHEIILWLHEIPLWVRKTLYPPPHSIPLATALTMTNHAIINP